MEQGQPPMEKGNSTMNKWKSPLTAVGVVFFQENVPNSGEWWVAQCVEYDIAAQARTMADARYELERMLATHIFASMRHGIKPFENTPSWQPFTSDIFLFTDPARDESQNENREK